MRRWVQLLVPLVIVATANSPATNAQNSRSTKLTPHHISLTTARSEAGKSFDLFLPDAFSISVAAQGLKRVRFMAPSPDGRIFVTDMFNLTDNRKGVVYILDDFDQKEKRFRKVTTYLEG